jgi:hypothetical protein
VTKKQLRKHGLISVTNDSIEHRNLLAHSVDSLDKNSGNCLCQACSPPAKFGIERRGEFEEEHVAACCSRVLTLKQQRAKKG